MFATTTYIQYTQYFVECKPESRLEKFWVEHVWCSVFVCGSRPAFVLWVGGWTCVRGGCVFRWASLVDGWRGAEGTGGSGKPVPEGATPATRRHCEAASSGPLVTLSLSTRAATDMSYGPLGSLANGSRLKAGQKCNRVKWSSRAAGDRPQIKSHK